MKNVLFLKIVGALTATSIIYETINSIINAIQATWTAEATAMIARSISTAAWLIGLSLAMILLAVAFAIFNMTNQRQGGNNRQQDQNYIDGQVGQPGQNAPYMLEDSQTEYVMPEAWQAQGSYIDNANNV